MCKFTDRKKEGWLREEDINKISLENLQRIDRLWQDSNQNFGFSVQTRIYQEILNDNQVSEDKIWETFCDRVGWRKEKEDNKYWLPYYELNYSDNTLEGHLPSRVFFITTFGKLCGDKYYSDTLVSALAKISW